MKRFNQFIIAPVLILLVSGMLSPLFSNSKDLGSPGTGFTENKLSHFERNTFRHSERPHLNRGIKSIKKVKRKGLAVIVDFANSKLEDWDGPGINDVSELSDQLHKMEGHWAWLSRGKEKFNWDIIRITLPVNLDRYTYWSWWEYRNAVADLVKQEIDVTKYDQNQDGIVDTVWIITSTSGQYYDYMTGGSALNNGINNFVDGQDSLSVISGATGNFNHEVGHTIGLQDMYGPYGTLSYLTLMSDSWPVPPQDFAAFERSTLGWVKPREILKTTRNIKLSSANKNMEAVRVPTTHKNEYFLIEYRQRPESGYGSVAPPYNGLAVYHILESSNLWTNPPLVKLEAADGYIAPDTRPELTDFFYPENEGMKIPFVAHSYFGGRKVFQIDNVHWADDKSLAFDINLSSADSSEVNLLLNFSFEQGNDVTPDFWRPNAWEPFATIVRDASISKEGNFSASILSPTPNDASWLQDVWNLTPGKSYEFCGFIRGSNVITGPSAGVGANVSVMGGFTLSNSLSGNFDWTKTCVTFVPETDSVTLACRLGFFGSTVTGQIWCDSMSLEAIESAF